MKDFWTYQEENNVVIGNAINKENDSWTWELLDEESNVVGTARQTPGGIVKQFGHWETE